MAIYLSFLVPKITAIVHATPTNARPTHSVWNHEQDRVSDFVPIASLLEWLWRRIVMRNSQFYHSSRNGAIRTAQCREIPHSFPEPFYQVLQARVGDPTNHPPAVSTRNWTKYNKSLKDPVRGAGSAQVQIRSYHNWQSGNLARKVRNTFPMCEALIEWWGDGAIQAMLEGSRRNKDVFLRISQSMGKAGYEKTGDQCSCKIKKLRLEYRKIKDKKEDWY